MMTKDDKKEVLKVEIQKIHGTHWGLPCPPGRLLELWQARGWKWDEPLAEEEVAKLYGFRDVKSYMKACIEDPDYMNKKRRQLLGSVL